MSRRVQGLDPKGPERPLVAVVKRLVLELRSYQPVYVDPRVRRRRQPPMTGHVIRMVVGLEHMLDPNSEYLPTQILIDPRARINDRRDLRVLIPDQVGRRPIFVQNCRKILVTAGAPD